MSMIGYGKRRPTCRVWSAVPGGNGGTRIHDQLAKSIPGYCIRTFDRRREYFPLSLLALRNHNALMAHVSPDHGALVVPPQQPMVATFHNFVLDSEMQASSTMVQRIHYRTDLRYFISAAVKRAAVITAVSSYTAGLVESYFQLAQPIRVIPNGVDTTIFSPRELADRNGTVKVLVSGNASRRKGTHLLKDIAAQLSPQVELLCTLTRSEVRHWIGDVPNVIALGKLPAHEMPDIYRQADVLLMPTAREGFGLAVAEAMACGLPIVASNNSTMPELVVDGEGGYLCSLDALTEFALRINQLAAEPWQRHQMGEFNRRRVLERFSVSSMLGGYRELFAELQDRISFRG